MKNTGIQESPAIRNILFDLDGTLVDSSGTIAASLCHALEKSGLGQADGPAVTSFIGVPLFDIFTSGYGMSESQTHVAIDHYRSYYDELNQAGSRIYDGVPDALSDLREAGYRLYIATVKPTSIAEKVLTDFDLIGQFNGVMGASMGPEHRDKTSVIARAVDRFCLEPDQCMMVGDRDQDIKGAQVNGMKSIGVTWGFGSREEIVNARPDHVAEVSEDITRIVLARAMDPPANGAVEGFRRDREKSI